MLFKPYSQLFLGLLQVSLWALLSMCAKDGIQYGNIHGLGYLQVLLQVFVIGLFNKKYDVTTGKFSLMSMIWFNLAQALALLIAYGIVTLLVIDSNLHKPGHTFYAQSFVAGVANFYYNCNWREPSFCNLCWLTYTIW